MNYFSCNKVWKRCAMFGVGVGRDADDGSLCLLIQFSRWLIAIGPHVPPNNQANRSEPAG